VRNNNQHVGRAYGFCVLYRAEGDREWTADGHEELHDMPAYYEIEGEAIDRVEYLRASGVQARMLTLLAEKGEVPT